MGETTKTHHILVYYRTTALHLLAEESGMSHAELKHAAQQGCIWWQAAQQKPVRIRRLKKELQIGEQLHCYINRTILEQAVIAAECIADEDAYSIWLKPRGMFSQGTKWGDANSISRYVEHELQRPTWLVHRLDRMTTGLMILSHQKSLVAAFEKAFTEHEVFKSYVAIVAGQFLSVPTTIVTALDNKPAKTEVVAAHYDAQLDMSLLEIVIHSGKKHQIRRHLANSGYPIIGDRLYGERADGDLQLVARSLGFTDPRNGERRNYALAIDILKSALLSELSHLVDQVFSDKVSK